MHDTPPLLRRLRRATESLRRLPLHPQWLMRADDAALRGALAAIPAGSLVVDVGCGHRWPERLLPAGCRYLGIDYPMTATEWYASTPDIFADAGQLPLADAGADCVLLLDVIEHLRDPQAALREACRVLRPGGRFLLRIPFAYPLHDEPLDFRRYTRHGIVALAADHGFTVEHLAARGHPLESAALLTNLALVKTVVRGLGGRLPAKLAAVLLAPLALLAIVAGNVAAAVLARLLPGDDFLPYAYTVVLRRGAT